MRSFETVPRMRGREIKENYGRGEIKRYIFEIW
jgi:hypothetical protein